MTRGVAVELVVSGTGLWRTALAVLQCACCWEHKMQSVGLSSQGVWGREIKQVVNRKAGSVSRKDPSGESLGAVAWPAPI